MLEKLICQAIFFIQIIFCGIECKIFRPGFCLYA